MKYKFALHQISFDRLIKKKGGHMIQVGILSIISLGVTVNLFAADSAIILQHNNQNTNLFISGEAADSLYDLFVKGVPVDSLPNGSYVEGGNLACIKTTSSNNDVHSFCAFSMGHEGLTKNETPSFIPSIASMAGVLDLKEQKNSGEILLTVSGEVGLKIFSLLNVVENEQGIKVGKNILCKKTSGFASCSTLINQRGFSNFPEAQLSYPPTAILNRKIRGAK